MYAVVKTGGKQYKVAPGEKLKIEQIPADVGAEVVLDQVLMVGEGETVRLGQPNVAGATVKATVVAQANRRSLDDDVIALVIRASPIEVVTPTETLGVRGVSDVPILKLGFSASPTGIINLPISGREIAHFDTSRFTVTLVSA